MQSTVAVLFESSENIEVLRDPTNAGWVTLILAVGGESFEILERRYYIALYHFRKQYVRPSLPNQIEIEAVGKQQALEGMLKLMEQRKAARQGAGTVFVDPRPRQDEELPEALRDFTKQPPPLKTILAGPGRPPCDALSLLKAFLASPLLGVGDDPTSVHRLLHSNPTFAHHCGFLGRAVKKEPGELTSRRLPSLSVCEEFSEVMTRYGLWHQARLEQVRDNLESGVVEIETTAVFDTAHIIAHSHCDNVSVPEAKEKKDKKGKKAKHRKVPRMRKRCDCGKRNWMNCEHPWVPTDQGAAVVVKGPTRIYWAHKASVATFADNEIPFDVRVCEYAAESDGKTLIPHLEVLTCELPEVVDPLRYILADDAYRENIEAVARFGQQARLIVPVHGRAARASLADEFEGIDRFTPTGIPICQGGHRFEMLGRDVINERYIWVAPDDKDGKPVCADCPLAASCIKKGRRRQIRLDRKDQPQINWEHPQHFAKDRRRYQKRTGVERAIKRLKVDLSGAYLTHRDGLRVQAHLDRKLLILHLLLKSTAET